MIKNIMEWLGIIAGILIVVLYFIGNNKIFFYCCLFFLLITFLQYAIKFMVYFKKDKEYETGK